MKTDEAIRHISPRADEFQVRAPRRKRAEPIVVEPAVVVAPPITVFWRWIWKAKLPDRTGQRFRVVARAEPKGMLLIEFDDGFRVVTNCAALGRRWEC